MGFFYLWIVNQAKARLLVAACAFIAFSAPAGEVRRRQKGRRARVRSGAFITLIAFVAASAGHGKGDGDQSDR